jgi:hypothetical protein
MLFDGERNGAGYFQLRAHGSICVALFKKETLQLPRLYQSGSYLCLP